MLLERAASLAMKITEYQKLQGMADEGERFQTRAHQLGTISERVSRMREALARFARAGVCVDFVPSDAVGYASKAKTLRTALKDNPGAINDPPFDLKNEFIDRLAGIVAAADKAMADGWRTYVAKRADFGSSDVLNALAEVPQLRQSVAKIRRCRADIDALAGKIPSDPQATVARLDEFVSMHDAAWSELSAEDIPRYVIDFIRAAASEGAALSAYSDEIEGWLKSRDLLSAFRIRIR